MTRFARFNLVGIIGFLVQLTVLVMLDALNLPLPVATCAAVEAAILHNYLWHERWTWTGLAAGNRASRLLRFHLANGLISIAGNACITTALVASGVPLVAAGLAAVLTCALLNFLVARDWVFCGR